MMAKRLPDPTTLSLCNVGRYRNGGPTHLVYQPISFLAWEPTSKFVDLDDEVHCFLPHNEILVTLNRHIPTSN